MHDPSSPAPSLDPAGRLFEPSTAERASERLAGVWLLGALAVHAALGLFMAGSRAVPRTLPPPALVDVFIEQRQEPKPPEPPPPAIEPEPPLAALAPRAALPAFTPNPASESAPLGPRSAPTEPHVPTEPHEAPPEAVSVLTSAGPATFAVPSGAGNTVGGTIAPGGSGSGSGSGTGSDAGAAPRDLSRGAIPPDLRRLLFVNYPPSARMERTEGTATVRVTVHPDGHTSDLRVTSVRPGGRAFGETCSRTVLQGPRWKPALDAFGKAISTTATYTCRFELPEASAPTATSRPTNGTGANRVWTRPAR